MFVLILLYPFLKTCVMCHERERTLCFDNIISFFPFLFLSSKIYSGFSQFCEDYCSDMWVWYFNESRWEQIPDREKDRLEPTIDGIRTGVMREPGRRWKFAQIQTATKLFLFGGHRLWHGFHPSNALSNHWENTGEKCEEERESFVFFEI